MTSFALTLPNPVLLILGLALLNWVFKPPYYQMVDLLLLIVCLLLTLFFASWAVMLNLGLEAL